MNSFESGISATGVDRNFSFPSRPIGNLSRETKLSVSKDIDHSLHDEYKPPTGIDSRPFSGLKRSDFFVKIDKKSEANPDLIAQCAQAVRDIRKTEIGDMAETVLSEAEVEAHLATYTQEAVKAASILNSEFGHTAIIASPVGGIPPLHAVMDQVVHDPDLLKDISFAPLSKRHPNPLTLSIIREAEAILHVDDGATLFEDQVLLLEHLEEDPTRVKHALAEIKRIHKQTGTCMSDEQMPFFKGIVDAIVRNNVVVAPVYSKNPRVIDMLYGSASNQDSAWAVAQRGVLERGIHIIPENKTLVGSAVESNHFGSIPCRDHGVTLEELSLEYDLHPKVEHTLREGGISKVDFRLFSNFKSLESIDPNNRTVYQYFAKNLQERILRPQ